MATSTWLSPASAASRPVVDPLRGTITGRRNSTFSSSGAPSPSVPRTAVSTWVIASMPTTAGNSRPHFCLGAGVARMVAKIGLSTLFARYPDLQLAGSPDVLFAAVRVAGFQDWLRGTLATPGAHFAFDS